MRPCAGQRRHLREQAFPLPRGVASGSQNGKLQFGATGTRRTGSATQCDLMTAPAIAREGLVVDLLGRTWSAWRAAGVVSRSGRPRDSAPGSDKVIALGWVGMGGRLIVGQESLGAILAVQAFRPAQLRLGTCGWQPRLRFGWWGLRIYAEGLPQRVCLFRPR